MTHNPTGPYGPNIQPGPNPQPAKASRPWFKKKRFIIPGALVVLAGLGGALSDGDEATEPLAASSTASEAPPTSESPAATQEPSAAATTRDPEPAPAEVTSSASGPESTQPAESEPAPEPEKTTPSEEPSEPEVELDPYSFRYGTFEPITESGSGDSVITMPEGVEAGLITATHGGSSNFVIRGIDDDYEMVDLFVNEIGSYSGTVEWGLTGFGDAPTTLQITGDGAWTITLSPITTAADQGTAISGTGDAVVKYEGDKGFAPVTHNGDSNFVVYQTDGTRPNLLVNEIGSYNGTIPIKTGPSLLIIRADGDWAITVG